jgi:hypothetical protein
MEDRIARFYALLVSTSRSVEYSCQFAIDSLFALTTHLHQQAFSSRTPVTPAFLNSCNSCNSCNY